MGTTSGGQFQQFDAKFLGETEQIIKFYIIDSQVGISLLKEQEVMGNWKTAKIGDIVQIRVPAKLADTQGMMGSNTMGTGGSKGGGGQSTGLGGSLMG